MRGNDEAIPFFWDVKMTGERGIVAKTLLWWFLSNVGPFMFCVSLGVISRMCVLRRASYLGLLFA